jgi:hypothetical protein
LKPQERDNNGAYNTSVEDADAAAAFFVLGETTKGDRARASSQAI